MAGKDIEMNAFKPTTSAVYIYAEAADGSQVKINISDLIKLLTIGNVSNSYVSDLNKAYEAVKGGLSLFQVDGNVINSPIPYSMCVHFQRHNAGVVTSSQQILQILFAGSLVKIRNGYGNGTTVVYTDWRVI